ncbi:hypothetical protein PT286_05880 [Neisseriaceae bacterium ESL0693]|nr:hypothetical protein [Neisseriaceae bacterium ESL0693]
MLLFMCINHPVTQTLAQSAGYPAELSCQHLTELTYNEMSAIQQQKANLCDQQQAAKQWQSVYGKLSLQDRFRATVYEPL